MSGTTGSSGTAAGRIPLTVIAKDSAAPFPMLENVWNIFSTKGIRTVYLTIGASASSAADLELAESIGCPLHVVPLNATEKEAWEEVHGILKERKRDEATAKHSFSVGAEARWILPKNLRLLSALPWWSKGLLDTSGVQVQTGAVADVIEGACATMKLKDGANRIDILKLDTTGSAAGLERGILQSILDAGYRPALILVNWSRMPDTDMPTTLSAGHLQNCGYTLLHKVDSKFLYIYTDKDMYQICSWESTESPNPMIQEVLETAREGFKQAMAAAAKTPA